MNEKAAPNPSPEFLSRYAAGVRGLAHDLGVPETDVRAALEFKPGKSPDCLRPEEVEDFAGLSVERRAHMESCGSCRELELAMNAAPTEDELERAIELARPLSEEGEAGHCPSCGQRWQQGKSVETWLRSLGISDDTIANLRTQMQNVDIEEYLNTARDYLKDTGGKATSFAKENPGKVAAGAAVIAVGAGLLISALNRD